MCGTEQYPTDRRAKKYKIGKHRITREDFYHIMRNLPVPVDDQDIKDMFEFADKDRDGKISYDEFQVVDIKYINLIRRARSMGICND